MHDNAKKLNATPRFEIPHVQSVHSGQRNILILDDFFPNLITGFRVAEYNHYLRVFPNLIITSTIGDFNVRHRLYAKAYPDIQNRVVAFDRRLLDRADFCYLNFLNNVHYYVDQLEDAHLPFLFTLYPGGGFELRSEESDRKLARVLASPMLRGVISTQPITTDVLRRFNCPVVIHDIYGVTVNPIYLHPSAGRTGSSGRPLRLCFVAHKYDREGRTKGYPAFIETAAWIAEHYPDIELSVVGNFGPDDVSLSGALGEKLKFKGLLATLQLHEFLLTQDVMISPNQPYTVSGSVFDGFPTASCIEASLCGVAIVCSDELNLNRYYGADELVICGTQSPEIISAIEPLLRNPTLTTQQGVRGREKSLRLFSAAAQLLPRTRILRDYSDHENARR